MVRPLPRNLSELSRYGGYIGVRCTRCHRLTRYKVSELAIHFERRKLSDHWDNVRRVMRCHPDRGGCGARQAAIYWSDSPPPPPDPMTAAPSPPQPLDESPPPPGIDARQWFFADECERKRLLRLLR